MEEKKPIEVEGADNTDELKVDAFGVEETQAPSVKKEETKEDDIEKNPLVVELRKQIDGVKKEYGGNLTGQREVISRLEKEVKELKESSDTKEETDVLFKDIKFSKDLTEEEKDDMSDFEIKQMDEIAKMQTIQNEQYIKSQKIVKENVDNKVDDLNSKVQEMALEITKSAEGKEDVTLANQIIESFKALGFNTDDISIDELKKKVEIAHTQIPDYKAPKEQVEKKGGVVKNNEKTGDDPFGNNQIIKEATSGQDGGYDL